MSVCKHEILICWYCNSNVWLELNEKIHSLFRGELHPPKVPKNIIIDSWNSSNIGHNLSIKIAPQIQPLIRWNFITSLSWKIPSLGVKNPSIKCYKICGLNYYPEFSHSSHKIPALCHGGKTSTSEVKNSSIRGMKITGWKSTQIHTLRFQPFKYGNSIFSS